MSDEDRERLEAEIESLRELTAAQSVEIERLTRTVAELTQRLNRGSKNSSLPPSADSPKHQAEATKTRAGRRAEAKARRRSVRGRCSCGTLNRGVFPREAAAPPSYGPNVRAAALYLLHGQHLSVERTAEAMSAMLGADVSTGFVASLANEAAGGLTGFIGEIRQRLRVA